MNNAIGFFSELKSIPYEEYYKKYININIGGNWQADNIQAAFGFQYRLLNDTKEACSVLSLYKDKEIKSVFRFLFDGPHPKNEHNSTLYNTLKPKIENQDKRLGRLLTEAYKELMAEDHRH